MKKIAAGNWKLHKTRKETESFLSALAPLTNEFKTDQVIAASPTLLETAVKAAEPAGVKVFSQNVAFEDSGAWTGEISPLQLKELGVKGSLVGHSERRSHFADSNETCAARAKAALKNNLDVIFCIGESLSQREQSLTKRIVEEQLSAAVPVFKEFTSQLPGVNSASLTAIAYEPVWAIGTGKVATVEQIEETHAWIHAFLKEHGLELPVLYGGSVKPSNFGEITSTPGVQGGLVGGASLEADSFAELVKILETAQ